MGRIIRAKQQITNWKAQGETWGKRWADPKWGGFPGLLEALCCSDLRVWTWFLPKACQRWGMLRQKSCRTDWESYFKGEPERSLQSQKLLLPAPNLRWVCQRCPEPGSCSVPAWSRISFFLPASVPQASWSVFCLNGKCTMTNCLNNLWYKETCWSKVQRSNLFPRK